LEQGIQRPGFGICNLGRQGVRAEVGEMEFGRLGIRQLGRAGVGGTEVCKTVFGGPGFGGGGLEAGVWNM
jgi:hypothetical protein